MHAEPYLQPCPIVWNLPPLVAGLQKHTQHLADAADVRSEAHPSMLVGPEQFPASPCTCANQSCTMRVPAMSQAQGGKRTSEKHTSASRHLKPCLTSHGAQRSELICITPHAFILSTVTKWQPNFFQQSISSKDCRDTWDQWTCSSIGEAHFHEPPTAPSSPWSRLWHGAARCRQCRYCCRLPPA